MTDFELENFADSDEISEGVPVQREPTEDRDDVVASVEREGYELERISSRYGNAELFRIFRSNAVGPPTEFGTLPHLGLSAFASESKNGWQVHNSALGLSSTDGRYVEMMLARFGFRTTGIIAADAEYTSPRATCLTARNAGVDYCSSFSTLYLGDSADFVPSGGEYRRLTVWCHVGDGRGACIELSIPSASLMAAYFGRLALERSGSVDVNRIMSIKLRFHQNASGEDSIKRAISVASTFFFELSAMGYGSPSFHAPITARSRPRPPRLKRDLTIRFPPQIVDSRASSLFVNADRLDSPLAKYLSYYQTIEYYLPFSDERSSIARLKREVFSPGFDIGNDSALLGLIRTIGRQVGKSERESFRDLVAFLLPGDKAKIVYESLVALYPDHFGKRGKIKQVSIINPSDATRTLSMQFADRIYDLRCRIVHSKALGGNANAEPLFPTDEEAGYIEGDIHLVRTVAVEAVSAFAAPNRSR